MVCPRVGYPPIVYRIPFYRLTTYRTPSCGVVTYNITCCRITTGVLARYSPGGYSFGAEAFVG